MRDHVGDGVGHNVLLAKLALVDVQLLGKQADHDAHKRGRDHPAPPRAAAPAQVNQRVADKADQAARHRAVHRRQQTEHRILQADVRIRNAAGDRHKAAEHKEQRRADGHSHNRLDRIFVVHDDFLLRILLSTRKTGEMPITVLYCSPFLSKRKDFSRISLSSSFSRKRRVKTLCFRLSAARRFSASVVRSIRLSPSANVSVSSRFITLAIRHCRSHMEKRAPVHRDAPANRRKIRRQPLTAPAVTPSMNCLCARKNTTSDGMMEIRETAITRFHAKPLSASMLMRTNSVAG